MKCKICGHESEFFDNTKLLRRYDVKYYRCPSCGFIQTEEPYWLEEAYSSAIADADVGLIGRNYILSKRVSAILKTCLFNVNSSVDWGGYGIFVRLMRDAGFSFEWYDKYCENLFAKGFDKKKDHYDVLTSFEPLEHLPNPMNDISQMMSLADNIICSTSLLPEPAPKISSWWYYAPTEGQHISFYTDKAMKFIASKFSRHYVRYGDIHIFSREHISSFKLKVVCRYQWLINRMYRRPSLLWKDFEAVVNR